MGFFDNVGGIQSLAEVLQDMQSEELEVRDTLHQKQVLSWSRREVSVVGVLWHCL